MLENSGLNYCKLPEVEKDEALKLLSDDSYISQWVKFSVLYTSNHFKLFKYTTKHEFKRNFGHRIVVP